MVRVLWGPVLAAALAGLFVAAVAYGRRGAWKAWPRWPFAVGLLVAALFAFAPLTGGPLVADVILVKLLGAATLVGSAFAAFLGSRFRVKAAVLISEAPRTIDAAIQALRAGEAPKVGVFEGRLQSADPVASPAGVVCAFYEAEVRAPNTVRGRGALLATDQGQSEAIFLRGERCQARIAFAPGSALGPVVPRRCRIGRLSWASGAELAQGLPPTDAISYERVGRIGEHCLVVGRLVRGLTEGSYVLKGPTGGPALIAQAEGVSHAGRRLLARAYTLFGMAAGAVVIAAYLLAA